MLALPKTVSVFRIVQIQCAKVAICNDEVASCFFLLFVISVFRIQPIVKKAQNHIVVENYFGHLVFISTKPFANN
jgi:hypothetical protein